MNSESTVPSQDKKPSPELFSLIKAAATNLLGFGELWTSIKKKGHDEGFSEKELQDILRPMLKPQLNKDQIYYLFNADQKKEQSKERYDKLKESYNRNITTDDAKKDTEQLERPKEKIPLLSPKEINELAETIGNQKIYPVTEPEEPTELELAEIRIHELEEALKKTEQFKPATALQEPDMIVSVNQMDDDALIRWLQGKADGVHSFYYDAYGIDLFKNRELSQLKNSGVRVFRRLYFEV